MSTPGPVRAAQLRKTYPGALGIGDAWRALIGAAPRERSTPPALDDVAFEVARGSSLGVIGRNGSGKTTLLRILAGALPATSGEVHVEGRVAALIDLAAGIDPRFSGRENAVMLMMLAGCTRAEALERIDGVHEFSGLGKAFDDPVRSYSSGMSLRLAFSSIMASEPDVLLVDEVLAVGDAFFQQRCLLRIRQLQEGGCTVVLVSHDPSSILGFCDSAIWLESGRVACSGDPGKVVREYAGAGYGDAGSLESRPDEGMPPLVPGAMGELAPASALPNIDSRHGDARARIDGIELRDDRSRPLAAPQPGVPIRVVISLSAIDRIESPVVGFSLRNRIGEIVSATNTAHLGHALPPLEAGQYLSVEFRCVWPAFTSGTFSMSPAVADGSLAVHAMNDWIDNALVTEFHNPGARYGWIELPGTSVRCSLSTPENNAEGDGSRC